MFYNLLKFPFPFNELIGYHEIYSWLLNLESIAVYSLILLLTLKSTTIIIWIDLNWKYFLIRLFYVFLKKMLPYKNI